MAGAISMSALGATRTAAPSASVMQSCRLALAYALLENVKTSTTILADEKLMLQGLATATKLPLDPSEAAALVKAVKSFGSLEENLAVSGATTKQLSTDGTACWDWAFGETGSSSPTTTTSPSATTTPETTAAAPSTPQVGSALAFQDSNGDSYSVRLVQVIDPAQGADQFMTPDPGDRFVAAVFKITDTGNAATSDDANNNASVVGSNDQSYSSGVDTVSECTNFNSGLYQLDPGSSLTGCVVFQIPTGVNVSKVEWSPSGGFGSSFGEWSVS